MGASGSPMDLNGMVVHVGMCDVTAASGNVKSIAERFWNPGSTAVSLCQPCAQCHTDRETCHVHSDDLTPARIRFA